MKNPTQQLYKEKAVPALQAEFKYANSMQVPKVEKVIVHVGTGTKSDYNLEAVTENLKKITGQAPVVALSKQAVSNFKLRKGQPIGLKVTLRGKMMYQFIDRLVNITLPRVHDFRGLSAKGFDKRGNYTIGLKEQLAFPEIKAESIEQLHGIEVTIVTSASSENEGYALLKNLGFPLQDKK